MYLSLTAGAIRSLELAARLAAEQGSATVGAGHLLWSFVILETRAAEILTQHGLTADSLATLYAAPPTEFDPRHARRLYGGTRQ